MRSAETNLTWRKRSMRGAPTAADRWKFSGSGTTKWSSSLLHCVVDLTLMQ
jgi:hypothetical protein